MQLLQMLAIPFMFFGDNILQMCGINQPPLWYKSFQENKMTVFMFIWIGNSFAGCSRYNYRYCLSDKKEEYIAKIFSLILKPR